MVTLRIESMLCGNAALGAGCSGLAGAQRLRRSAAGRLLPDVGSIVAIDRRHEGSSSSGIGGPAKSLRHGRAINLAHRAERLTRALAVAIPVFAYICL